MFDAHEIIRANGCSTESQPAARMLGAMDDAQRLEIEALFPELQQVEAPYPQPASRSRRMKPACC